MKLNKLFLLLSAVMMVVVMAACSDAGTTDDGDSGNEDGVDVSLSQTETIEAQGLGNISVSYPEGWVAQGESGAVIIASSEDVLAIEDPASVDEIPAGSVLISVTIIPTEMGDSLGLSEDASPNDVIDVFSALMTGEDFPELSESEDVTIGGKPAAVTRGSDDKLNASIYAIVSDNVFIVGLGATRPDEADQHTATIEAILGSVTFTEDASE